MKYTIGADPETFIRDEATGKFVSSHDLVLGDKEAPYHVENGATQVDGVSAEFNINPTTNAQQFSNYIESVKDQMLSMIRTKLPTASLVCAPVATFDKEYFEALPEETKALGCTPDWDAYKNKKNIPPFTEEPFRTGSGHIHIGYERERGDELDVCNRMKQLDYILYPISLLWDDEQKRRTLYGKPGAFRYKPYGAEYRVLSNKWVGDTDLQKWVFNSTVHAMKLYDAGEELYDNIPPDASYERSYLLSYHKAMVEEYGLPSLPEKYLSF